jgi:hypothetical protein
MFCAKISSMLKPITRIIDNRFRVSPALPICSDSSLKRYGFLIGCNYDVAPSAGVPSLSGPRHDVHNMRMFLQDTVGFETADIGIVTDEDRRVTRNVIIDALNAFAVKTTVDDLDFAFFYYSGHGSSVPSSNGLEQEDECMIGDDAMNGGIVLDDEIQTIINTINPKTRVLMMFDCCHSGTMADLKYMYNSAVSSTVNDVMPDTHPMIIAITGCTDDQTSAEGVVDWFDPRGSRSGYLTGAFIRLLTDQPELSRSCLQTLDAIHRFLHDNVPGIQQVPQINSSFPLSGETRVFL